MGSTGSRGQSSAGGQLRKFRSLKCAPQSRRSDQPSPEFVANADGIREHREASQGGRHGERDARRNPRDEEEKPDVEAPEALASAEAFRRGGSSNRLAAGSRSRSEDGGVPQRADTAPEGAEGASERRTRGKASLPPRPSQRGRHPPIRPTPSRWLSAFHCTRRNPSSASGAAIMIRDAVTSRRVVIEPFDAPPALAARGLTGKGLSRVEFSTNSAVCRTPPAAVPQRGGLSGAWTPRHQSSRCRRLACPSANSRASSKSGSGMTCTSTGT